MKNVDNGTIGEIRTQAFLIDRFWILERSIDIQGADYIIQRKLVEKNLLDKVPPRFGVVQVKFMQDKGTSHYIHSEYILDEEQLPRKEFFLMIHTGNEEHKRMLLLSATDITNNFTICKEGSNKGKYYIPGNILDSSEYDVVNNKLTLDRIEHAIMLAEFTSNRRFLSLALPSILSSKEEIDYEYTLPLENNWIYDIPKEFVRLKNEISSFLFEIEEIFEKVKVSLEKTNPLDTIAIINKQLNEHGLFGRDFNVDLENLKLGIEEHQRKYHLLKKIGVIDNYLKLKNTSEAEIIKFLEPKMEFIGTNQAYQMKLKYKKEDLSDFEIYSEIKEQAEISLSPGPVGSTIGVSHSELGEIIIYYFPLKFGGYKGESWSEKLNNALDMIVSPLMSEIFFCLFPEERDYDPFS